MDILNLLESYINKDTITSMIEKSGLNEDEIKSVISKVAPSFMSKANENLQNNASSFIDTLNNVNSDEVKSGNIDEEHGKNLLSYFTGSKDDSTNLANKVGSELGLNVDSIKKLLPMISPLLASSFKNNLNLTSSNAMDTLKSFIDKNNDGSIMDDVAGFAKGFFK